MRMKDDLNLNETIEKELATQFEEDREKLRQDAKGQIQKTPYENRRGFKKHRKTGKVYEEEDWVAIQWTPFRPELKSKGKFLGLYRITRKLRNDCYLVEKVGKQERPRQTSTSADHIKPWGMRVEEENQIADVESDHDN